MCVCVCVCVCVCAKGPESECVGPASTLTDRYNPLQQARLFVQGGGNRGLYLGSTLKRANGKRYGTVTDVEYYVYDGNFLNRCGSVR